MTRLLTPLLLAGSAVLASLFYPSEDRTMEAAGSERSASEAFRRSSLASPRRPGWERAWDRQFTAGRIDARERRLFRRLREVLDPAVWAQLSEGRRRQLLAYAHDRLERGERFALCWSPETPPEVLAAFHAVEEAAQTQTNDDPVAAANQTAARWSETATDGSGQNVQGRPITLTWSIVPDGTQIPSQSSVGDSDDPSDLRSWLAGIYGGDAGGDPEDQPWFPVFEAVFANIAAQTGLRYVYEPNDDGATLNGFNDGALGVRGDIRIGAHLIDGNGGVLAYNFFPDGGDMVLDSADSFFNTTSSNSLRLRNTIEHEHGHGLGIEHVCPIDNTKLMEPFINLNFRGFRFDDLYSAQRLYGDPFEAHGSLRDNDSAARASPLGVGPGDHFQSGWLSIDDNGDVDHFALEATSSSFVTVRVMPSSQAYLEGPQNSDGTCSAGANFDSSSIHDLRLDLIAPDRSTVLATANANPAGESEEILSFAAPADGTYTVRVSGGGADACQLYQLEVAVVVSGVLLSSPEQTIVQEAFLPANGIVDPGETVRLEVAVRNDGSGTGTDVSGELSGGAGFVPFATVQGYGDLGPGAESSADFLFALAGACGDEVALTLTLTADGEPPVQVPLRYRLGTPAVAFREAFDAGAALPAGWSSSSIGSGSGWAVTSSSAASAPNSAFAPTVANDGESRLTSPAIVIDGNEVVLRFRHRYETEANADGGVLEVSVGGGGWQDIRDAGGVFLAGGYNSTLDSGRKNPLPNRQAWSGNSGGFVECAVALPASLAGQSVRFCWRLGHDKVGSANGWFVDNIELTGGQCEPPGNPAVTMTVLDATLSESDPDDSSVVRFETPLPLVQELPIPLMVSGTADPDSDLTGLDPVAIPAGQLSADLTLTALADGEVEGSEVLTLALDAAGGVYLVAIATADLVIADTPYGEWAFTQLGLVPFNGPFDDFDADGASNLVEYAWGTGPDDFGSFPLPAPRPEGSSLRIDAPVATAPPDVILIGETTDDLVNWTTVGVQVLADGFAVPMDGPRRFLRVGVQLAP